MKFNTGRQALCLAFMCAIFLNISASMQAHAISSKTLSEGAGRVEADAESRDTVRIGDELFLRTVVYIPINSASAVNSNVRYVTGQVWTETPSGTQAKPAGTIQKTSRRGMVYDTPLMMGVKTNLVGDALVIPNIAVEMQFLEKFSAELQLYNTRFNVFNNFDENANVYGFSPEVRFWPGGKAMGRGQFVGLHARATWYTLQWKDDFLYQNGLENKRDGEYYNAGNGNPAWTLGVTYGYSLGFGPKKNWGLEFLLGVGYTNNKYNKAAYEDGAWVFVEHKAKHQFGLTKVGVNLFYRFSLRKVNPKYYENN